MVLTNGAFEWYSVRANRFYGTCVGHLSSGVAAATEQYELVPT